MLQFGHVYQPRSPVASRARCFDHSSEEVAVNAPATAVVTRLICVLPMLLLDTLSMLPQALKVLDTYCANVQRQGSGRIQNKAAYLMSLIQSSKLGPAAGTPGSVQRLIERLSPAVRRAVDAVFDPVVDRVVLEDRALMELLAKVPEEQVRHTDTYSKSSSTTNTNVLSSPCADTVEAYNAARVEEIWTTIISSSVYCGTRRFCTEAPAARRCTRIRAAQPG